MKRISRIDLKNHFSLEENRLRKPANKNWVPTNNHCSAETYIEATRNDVKEKNRENATNKIF